jgi:hypothetical protein
VEENLEIRRGLKAAIAAVRANPIQFGKDLSNLDGSMHLAWLYLTGKVN